MSTSCAGPESQKTAIRLLVVDDHPVVRAGICAILKSQSDMQVVATAADQRDAMAAFRLHRPDVAVVDLHLRQGSGVDLIREIRAENPSARVLVLTNFCGEEEIYNAFAAGALGYVLKLADGAEIMAAVRAAYAGQRYIPVDVSVRLAQRAQNPPLTEREVEVLRLMARGGRNRAIASFLGLAEETVRSHIKSILRKLGVRGRTEAAVAAAQRGFIRPE